MGNGCGLPMVAIENTPDTPAHTAETAYTRPIVLFAMLGTALLVVASLVLAGASGSGWKVAADMVSRFALLLFVAAMTVEPLARLLPLAVVQAAGRERHSLILAFICATGASVACVAAPALILGESWPIPAAAYCFLTAIILVVMLFSAHPATIRFLGEPSWRALQRIAVAYFWIMFVLTDADRLIGPHRPDSWPGFALLLLTAALLLRFADAFVAHWRVGQAVVEKAA